VLALLEIFRQFGPTVTKGGAGGAASPAKPS
jgi:hypothetical protein